MVPVAATLKLALVPTGTVWLQGCVLIVGPVDGELTLITQVVYMLEIAPLIVVPVGRVSVPFESVIVFAEAKAVPSKLMLPPPAEADSSKASRRLHVESVPVPAAVCGVQLEAVPASSLFTVTTKLAGVMVKVAELLLPESLVSPANVALAVAVPTLVLLL